MYNVPTTAVVGPSAGPLFASLNSDLNEHQGRFGHVFFLKKKKKKRGKICFAI
jgi:hypothetical protein